MTTKSIIAVLLLSVFSLSLRAAPVNRAAAKKRAEEFLEQKIGRKTSLNYMEDSHLLKKSKASSPSLYIFNGEETFAIVSGDDRFPSIIGYGLNGTLDQDSLPENLESWLEMWNQIISTQTLPQSGSKEVKDDLPSELLLETALWDQGTPYNDLCPVFGGERSVTGCTATATCIIMRYHKWPEKGSGTLPAYTYKTDSGESRTVSGFALGDTYEWDNMPLKTFSTDKEKSAVAKVMYDVGVMIKSSYDPGGTGSHPIYVQEGLIKYMDYDPSMELAERSYTIDDGEWNLKIKRSLNECGPVLYAGYTSGYTSGHAFIVDGYDKDGNFHINWGWSGSGNGYFTVPSFSEFTEGHSALLYVQKNKGGSALPDLRIYEPPVKASTTTFMTGQDFTFEFNVGNYSTVADFNGVVSVAKFDRDYNIEEIIGDRDSVTIAAGQVASFTDKCIFTTEIKRGDRAGAVYRFAGSNEWRRIIFERDTEGDLILEDLTPLVEMTSVSFDPDSRILVITTKKGAELAIRSVSGEPVNADCVTRDDYFDFSVATSDLPLGEYTVTITKGSDVVSFSVVTGVQTK